jgi:hypothetical protein
MVPCEYNSSNGDAAASKQRRRSRPLTMEEKEDEVLPHLKPVPGTELRFTQFPERHFPEGSTPSQITHHSLDSTYVLETMVAKSTRCVFPCNMAELVYINNSCTGFINLKAWHVI